MERDMDAIRWGARWEVDETVAALDDAVKHVTRQEHRERLEHLRELLDAMYISW